MEKRKPIRIIEYQEDRQRTPSEAIEFLKDEIERGEVTHMIVLYRNEDQFAYISASEKRDYSNSLILWDAEQWRQWFVSPEGH